MKKKSIRGRIARLICLGIIAAVLVSGPGSAQAALNDTERAKRMTEIVQVYRFLTREMGYNTAAACGVMGNIDIECCFDPTSLSKSGLYYGLCQWGSNRRDHLEEFCKENGYKVDTIEGQLYFIQHELESTEYYVELNQAMLDMPNTEEGAYEAGYYWGYYYERPGDKENSSIKRGNMAQSAYWPIFSAFLEVPELTSVSNTDKGIRVLWEGQVLADSYTLYRRTSAKEEWKKLASVTGTSYVDADTAAGKTYHYAVEAVNTVCDSGYDPEGISCVRLPSPVLNQASAAADHAAISWEAVAGAEKYRIYRRTSSSDPWSRIATISAKNTSYRDTDAVSGKTNCYTVRAICGDSLGSYNTVGVSTHYLKQPNPSAANRASGIRISWTASPGAHRYRVYRRTSSGWTVLAKVSGDTLYWDHKDVAEGESCTYTVRAFQYLDDFTGSSLHSSGVTLSRVSAVKLRSLNATQTGASLTWDKLEKATSYRVYRRFSTSDEWSALGNTLNTRWEDNGLKGNSMVYYTVVAFIGSSRGDYDRSGLALLYLTPPVITGASNDISGINVSWEAVKGADRYYVYRREHGTTGWPSPAIVSAPSTSWTDKNALSGHSYDYVVRAGKGKTRSYYDPKGITTLRLGAPDLKALTTRANGLRLTWAATEGASSYRIYRREESGSWDYMTTVAGTQTAWTDNSVVNGRMYTYRVRGYASLGGTTVPGAFLSSGIGSCYVAPVKNVMAFAGIGKLRLTWTPNTDVTGYRIHYSESSSFSPHTGITAKGASTAGVDITGLTGGTTQYVKISAYINRNGRNYFSAASTAVSDRIG